MVICTLPSAHSSEMGHIRLQCVCLCVCWGVQQRTVRGRVTLQESGKAELKCACQCVCAFCFCLRVNRNYINPSFLSPCPCVFVIFNNTVSIQQLIQLTRIQIINEHAFSPFWREAVSAVTMSSESARGFQLKVCWWRQWGPLIGPM